MLPEAISHHVMPKVLVLKPQDVMRCDHFWRFSGPLLAEKDISSMTCFLLLAADFSFSWLAAVGVHRDLLAPEPLNLVSPGNF